MTDRFQVPCNGKIWYTDGSKKRELAGAEVHKRRGGKGIILPLGKYTIILQAETTNILTATQLALQEGGRRKLLICTESRAGLTTLQSMGVESRHPGML